MGANVAGVFRTRTISEVNHAIIGRVAVDMVDLIRPYAVFVQPRQSMGSIQHIINPDDYRTIFTDNPRPNAYLGTTTAVLSPMKQPGIRVVSQKLFQPLLRQIH